MGLVTRKDGSTVNVVVPDGDKKAVTEAENAVKNTEAPVYPNINHPVAKGHDLVAVGPDASKVLVDGSGAHNSPMNAVEADGTENGDPKVTASGMDEAAYKQVPHGHNDGDQDARFATEAEVKQAKKDSAPAAEVTPEPAKVEESKSK